MQVVFLLHVSSMTDSLCGPRRPISHFVKDLSVWVWIEWMHTIASIVLVFFWLRILSVNANLTTELQAFPGGVAQSDNQLVGFFQATNHLLAP